MSQVQQQGAGAAYASARHSRGHFVSEGRDADLIEQAQAGNQAAFETLVERYTTPLYQFIARYFWDYDRRCDVLQQVLIQLYLSLPDLHTDKPVQAWLFRVARNRCVDELRHRYVPNFSTLAPEGNEEEVLFSEGAPILAPSVEDEVEQHEVQHLLCQAITHLPPKYRPIVWLRYTTLLNFAQIGRLLHIPEATAKTYFQRAKLQLRQSLAQVLD